jgi:hypothetical protein
MAFYLPAVKAFLHLTTSRGFMHIYARTTVRRPRIRLSFIVRPVAISARIQVLPPFQDLVQNSHNLKEKSKVIGQLRHWQCRLIRMYYSRVIWNLSPRVIGWVDRLNYERCIVIYHLACCSTDRLH